MQRMDSDSGNLMADADALAALGKTPLFVAINGKIAAGIAVSDPTKPGAIEANAALKSKGLSVAIISGGAQATVQSVSGMLGIDHIVSEVMPKGKTHVIKALGRNGKKGALVGNGGNDAPTLASGDVGPLSPSPKHLARFESKIADP